MNKILILFFPFFLFAESDANLTDCIALGLEQSDYNFLMGLTANFLGFTMVFLVGFLFVLQGRR
jgi:hypothetical protein